MEFAGPSTGVGDLKFINSERGKPVVLRAGHRYNFVKKNKCGTTNWRCVNKSECSSSITLDKLNRIVRESRHMCLPDFKKNAVDSLMDECKALVCKNLDPIPKLFEDFMDTADCELIDEEKSTFAQKKDILYKARKNYLKMNTKNYKNLKSLKLPHSLVGDFFLYDDGVDDKILIFGSRLAQQYLKKFRTFYGDGTFKVCPTPFYQVYSIHINISHDDNTVNFDPVLFILLPNKTQATYERLFTILRNQFSVIIDNYKCDFEIATIQAVKLVYPDVKVTGCYFHYWKAILKKCQNVGFDKTADGEFIMRLYMQLPLLPPILVPEAILSIHEIANDSEEYKSFNNYFTSQWMGIYTENVFTCYNENFRTNNPVEGWHARLKKRFPVKPPLYLFIQLLKKESRFQDTKLKNEQIYCKGKQRNAKVMQKNCQINKIVTAALNNEISVIDCLKRLCKIIFLFKTK
ncbi:hypothetical protein ABMA28_000360 [Loxostege sticticalis]|uniref:FLYWCH-type domain-containing protein n=1 Tax=Loxostege sticticalis TaxID=481309 RepID=A0ABD0TRZ2_LOXSC